MASAPPNSNALLCPNCHAMNPPGAMSCGVCGASPLAQAGAMGAQPGYPGYPPQPGYYPPPPGYPPAPSAYPAPSQAAAFRPPVAMDVPVDQAAQRAIGALQAAGCQITGQTPPGAMANIVFVKPYSDLLTTCGMTVKYNGTLTITPEGEGHSTVATQLVLDAGTVTPIYVVTAVAGLVVIWFSILIGIVAAAGTIWFVRSQLSGSVLNTQLDLIVARLGGGYGAPPGYGFPPPAYGAAPNQAPAQGYPPPPPFTPGR